MIGGLDVAEVDVDASIVEAEPPKCILCSKNQLTSKYFNSCTLSCHAISLCANRILVNVSPGQTDAATSMRSLTMGRPVIWQRGAPSACYSIRPGPGTIMETTPEATSASGSAASTIWRQIEDLFIHEPMKTL